MMDSRGEGRDGSRMRRRELENFPPFSILCSNNYENVRRFLRRRSDEVGGGALAFLAAFLRHDAAHRNAWRRTGRRDKAAERVGQRYRTKQTYTKDGGLAVWRDKTEKGGHR